MCDFNKGFILCTCEEKINDYENSKENKKGDQVDEFQYVWKLNRFIGFRRGDMMGIFEQPRSDLGSGLTSRFVVNQLNSKNCFDFDFIPNENDNLYFYKKKGYEVDDLFEFVFLNGKWEQGNILSWKYITEKEFEGKIKKDL
jgi:hypothetical protein